MVHVSPIRDCQAPISRSHVLCEKLPDSRAKTIGRLRRRVPAAQHAEARKMESEDST